jgi:hypothetical protein
MSEMRTLRWGSSEIFQLPAGDTKTNRVLPRQMIQLSWDVPLSWVVWLIMNPQLAGDETNTLTVTWTFTVGIGQATLSSSAFSFAFAGTGVSPNIKFAPQQQQLFIPGQDIQLSVALSGLTTASGPESFQVGAFGAPNNADVLGEMRRWEEQHGSGASQENRDMHMGGPHESPLRYMPR